MLDYLHDVVKKSHVEHSVGLVEYEVLHAAQVDASELEVGYEAAGSGYHYVGSALEAVLLSCKFFAVGAAIDGHTRDGEIVGESFELAVNLLCELACRGHDYAAHRVGRLGLVGKHVDNGQKIGSSLSGACLGHGYQVAFLKYHRYGLFLYGGTLPKPHGVECVEHIVAQLQFVKSHLGKITSYSRYKISQKNQIIFNRGYKRLKKFQKIQKFFRGGRDCEAGVA